MQIAENDPSLISTSFEKNDVVWLLSERPNLENMQSAFEQILKNHFEKTISQYPKLSLSEIPDCNWLDHVYEMQPPFERAGFHIFGSHDAHKKKPTDKILIEMNAARAFGAGTHGTTAGCLDYIERLKQSSFKPKKILDVGTGSGILTIAAHKIWDDAIIVATDIEQDAIETSQEQFNLNNCNSDITLVLSDNLKNEPTATHAPYDLIMANILAEPLSALKNDIIKLCAPNAHIILSGISNEALGNISDIYTSTNTVEIIDQINIDGWNSLLLKHV